VQDWFHQHKPSIAPQFRPYDRNTLPTQWYKQFERSVTQDSMWTTWFIYYIHIEQLYNAIVRMWHYMLWQFRLSVRPSVRLSHAWIVLQESCANAKTA